MSDGQLIIDNSVLSSFHTSGWFHGMGVWYPEYELVTSRRIWHREFRLHHEQAQPEWLAVTRADLSAVESRTVALGDADWSLLAIAHDVDEPILVTNDRKLREVADDRGLECTWGTKFLIETFKTCGISRESFTDGLSDYTTDVILPDDVVRELRSTEKD